MHATQPLSSTESLLRPRSVCARPAHHTSARNNNAHKQRLPRPRRGFSLTELLVVIGIIVLMVGILLVALGQVKRRADRTRTESIMQQFANACMSFHAEHGMYPGVIPDEMLSQQESGPTLLSSMENALLHLMGGYRVLNPSNWNNKQANDDYNAYLADAQTTNSALQFEFGNGTWKMVVNVRKIGEGPVINGKPYAPYFSPGASDMIVVSGQVGDDDDGDESDKLKLPDLVDAWGQPIIYLRQVRTRGPLTGPANDRPQFLIDGALPYLDSTGLGELSVDQTTGVKRSMLHIGGDDTRYDLMALILAHPAFYDSAAPRNGQARGGFVLLSAGADGVYFSCIDGPGTEIQPIEPGSVQEKLLAPGPNVIDEFNDVRVFGGG